MPCEDFPCCGHEAGDCPRVDEGGGEHWRCVGCGSELPLGARSSLCAICQGGIRDGDYDQDELYDREDR